MKIQTILIKYLFDIYKIIEIIFFNKYSREIFTDHSYVKSTYLKNSSILLRIDKIIFKYVDSII